MDNPITIPLFLQTGPLHMNEAPEDFSNNLSLDWNREILDFEENEAELMMRMPNEHFIAYFQSKSDSEVLQAENHLLMEKNEELKNQHQELWENIKKLEAEKLIVYKMLNQAEAKNISTEKKLIKAEERNQGLLKDLEELKVSRLVIKILQKDNDEMKNQNQMLLRNREIPKEDGNKDDEEVKANQLIKDEKFAQEAQNKIQELLKELDTQVEDKNQEVHKDYEQLKAAQLINDKKLAEAENRIQELLKGQQVQVEERILLFLKNNEIEDRNQQLHKNYEELKATQLIKDKKLMKAENRIQELLKELDHTRAYVEEQNRELLKNSKELKVVHNILTKTEKRIQELLRDQHAQVEERDREFLKNSEELKVLREQLDYATNLNQYLFKSFEEWERDILSNKKSNDQDRVDLAQKTQELMNVTKEKEEVVSQQLEQKSQELPAFQFNSEPQQMPAHFEEERLVNKLTNEISNLESVNESLRDQISTFRVKISKLLYQMSLLLRLTGADFKFNFCQDNRISLNLEQLTECIPKLKLAIQRLISSNSQMLQTEILQDISNRDQSNRKFRPVEELKKVKHEDNKENWFLEQIPPPISTSITLNSKRNFESVGDGFKKDNVTIIQDQWNSLNPEPLIIKKLKNN